MNTPSSPLTGNQQVELVRRYPVELLRRLWLSRFAIDISDELRDVDEIAHWKCLDTGLEFFTPDSTEGTSELYQQLSCFSWYHDTQRWEFDAALPWVSESQSLLEVGCGNGAFLDLLSSRDAGQRIYGLELNPATAQQARDKGHQIIQKPLDSEQVQQLSPIDTICSFQVLEHVGDPLGFVRSMASLLRPGGTLVLGVPNAECFIRHWKVNLLDLPPHHMSRWHVSSLESLASLLGLKLQTVLVEPLSKPHSIDYVEAQTQRLLPLPILPHAVARVLGPILSMLPQRQNIPGHTLLGVYRKPEGAFSL